MTSIELNSVLLAVNSAEWLNLCARGSIRMSKRRPVVVSNPVSDRQMEKVFAAAPFTKMESSVDLFVLEITNQWTKSARRHGSFPSEILLLSLTDVISHHPVAAEHLAYYRTIGEKCGVHLDEPIFERAWVTWITNETVESCVDAAEHLREAFQFEASYRRKRPDKYTWGDVARLVLRPNEPIKAKPALVESLLSNTRKIADAVAGTRDTEQFLLACSIEWIDIKLGKDPTKTKAVRDQLLTALENAKERPLDEPGEQTRTALELLHTTFPKAFSDEITPMTVAHMVQLISESRSKKIKPQTVSYVFQSHRDNSASTALIGFVLASFLGVELTNQLIRIGNQLNPTNMTWESPNYLNWTADLHHSECAHTRQMD